MQFLILIVLATLISIQTQSTGYIVRYIYPNTYCGGTPSTIRYYPVGICTPNAAGQQHSHYIRTCSRLGGYINEIITYYSSSSCLAMTQFVGSTRYAAESICGAYAAGESFMVSFSTSIQSSSAGAVLVSEYMSVSACLKGDSNFAALITLTDNICHPVTYLAAPSRDDYTLIAPTLATTGMPSIRYKSVLGTVLYGVRSCSMSGSSLNATTNVFTSSSCSGTTVNTSVIPYSRSCALVAGYYISSSCYSVTDTTNTMGLIVAMIIGFLFALSSILAFLGACILILRGNRLKRVVPEASTQLVTTVAAYVQPLSPRPLFVQSVQVQSRSNLAVDTVSVERQQTPRGNSVDPNRTMAPTTPYGYPVPLSPYGRVNLLSPQTPHGPVPLLAVQSQMRAPTTQQNWRTLSATFLFRAIRPRQQLGQQPMVVHVQPVQSLVVTTTTTATSIV